MRHIAFASSVALGGFLLASTAAAPSHAPRGQLGGIVVKVPVTPILKKTVSPRPPPSSSKDHASVKAFSRHRFPTPKYGISVRRLAMPTSRGLRSFRDRHRSSYLSKIIVPHVSTMGRIDDGFRGMIDSVLDVTAFIGRGANLDPMYRPLERAMGRELYIKDDNGQTVPWRDVEVTPGTSLSSVMAQHIAPRLSRITISDILDLLESTYPLENTHHQKCVFLMTPDRAIERMVAIVEEAQDKGSGGLVTPPSPFASKFAYAYASHKPGEHHSYGLPGKL